MKYWFTAVSSAVSTPFSASITWGSPLISVLQRRSRSSMRRAPRRGHSNEIESGVRESRGKRDALAGADETFDVREGGDRCGLRRLGGDDLADHRTAAAAHASRAAHACDLAHGARALAHGLADRAIAHALAVADDHARPPAGHARTRRIIANLKMDFNIDPSGPAGEISPREIGRAHV